MIAAWLEYFPEKSDWCRNEQVCQGRKSVKRFERSNGLDTALYKNKPFGFMMMINFSCGSILKVRDSMKILVTCADTNSHRIIEYFSKILFGVIYHK